MAQTHDTAKRAVPRGFKILLGLSLALNLAVIGVVAGAVFRKGDDGPRRGGGGQANYARPYLQALPHEDRRAIFKAARAFGKGVDHATRRKMFQDVTDLLRSDVFDRSAVEAALGKQTEASLTVQDSVQVQWLNRIDEMGLQERRDYADAVEKALKRGPPHKRKPKSN